MLTKILKLRIISGIALLASLLPLRAVQSVELSTTYYVSAQGNDSATGTSSDQAWKSLQRVQSHLDTGALGSGVQIRFRRGDTFFGNLVFGASASGTITNRRIIGAYGTGNAPILSGLVDVSNWTSLGNNRWRATCNACTTRPAMLLLNGVPRALARWPNLNEADKGYRYYTTFSGKTQIGDPLLATMDSWVGGEVVLRTAPWILDRLPIVSQSAGTLTFGSNASYEITQGFGYFVQDHPQALDREGEWIYDPASKALTLYAASDPNARRIEVPVVDTLLTINGASHMTFEDLTLHGSQRDAIYANNSSQITFDRLALRHVGRDALNTINCNNLWMANSRAEDVNNVGVRMQPCDDCGINSLTLERIGMLAGMGQSGDGQYFGALIGGSRFQFLNSVLTNIGYAGVGIYGSASVRNNRVAGFNAVKNDGSGIYTYRSRDIEITDNLVRDAKGSTAGTPWTGTGTSGIYIDDDSERVTVARNTVLNIGEAGIYLHNTRDVTVTDNLVVNSHSVGLQMIDDGLGDYALERNVVRNNQIIAGEQGGPVILVSSSLSNEIFGGGIDINNNAYCDPFRAARIRVSLPASGSSDLSMAQWRAQFGRDLASSECADRYPEFVVTGTPGPNLVPNSTFDTDINGWFGWSNGTLDARWESGRLDGGSLRVGFGSTGNVIHMDTAIGAINDGQMLQLQLDAIVVTGLPGVVAYLRKAGEPYNRVSAAVPLDMFATRQSQQIFLGVLENEPEALLIFESTNPGTAFGVDNVRLRNVLGTQNTLDKVLRVETNESGVDRMITLDAEYRDVRGTTYSAGTAMTIRPNSAVALLRLQSGTPFTPTPTQTPTPTATTTATPTPAQPATATATPTPVQTATATATRFQTSTATATSTPTAASTATATSTSTSTTSPTPAATDTATPTAMAMARLTVRLDAVPDSRQNFRFQGTLPAFLLDDITPQDGDAYTNSRQFSLPAGDLVINQVLPRSWFMTKVVCSGTGLTWQQTDRGVRLSLAPAADATCTFINTRGAIVRAAAFEDLNYNGQAGANEPPLSGQNVQVFGPDGRPVATGTTNGRGHYDTDFLPDATMSACAIAKIGWTITLPLGFDPNLKRACASGSPGPNQRLVVRVGAARDQVTTLFKDSAADVPSSWVESMADVEFDDNGNVAANVIFVPMVVR